MGIWIAGEGMGCFRGPTTDSCAPRLTCHDGRCRRLCRGDGECTGSDGCCNLDLPGIEAGVAMSSGFKACGPCP